MSQFLPIPKPKHHRRQQNSNGGYCLVPAYTEQEMADFAALVAAAEREECAKVCDEAMGRIFPFSDEVVQETGRNVCANIAAAIRARGNT